MGILAVFALPLLLLGISGIIYIYQTVIWLVSKSAVQNKVVVITDAISGLGKGELFPFSVWENTTSMIFKCTLKISDTGTADELLGTAELWVYLTKQNRRFYNHIKCYF